jgi:hypothetical protein
MDDENIQEVPQDVDIDAQARQEGEDAFLEGDAPEEDPAEGEGEEEEKEQKVDYLQDPSK